MKMRSAYTLTELLVATAVGSIQVAPVDSLVIPQDTLVVPILPDSTIIDTTIIE